MTDEQREEVAHLFIEAAAASQNARYHQNRAFELYHEAADWRALARAKAQEYTPTDLEEAS